jgi:hypothetical protein
MQSRFHRNWISNPACGWIYAAQEVGTPLVKIGFTWWHTPQKRLMELWYQYHVPLSFVALVFVPTAVCMLERHLHRRLASARIEHEWFYLPMNQATLEALVAELTPAITAQVAAQQAYLLAHRG